MMNYLNRLCIHSGGKDGKQFVYVTDEKFPESLRYDITDGIPLEIPEKITLDLKNTTKIYPDFMGSTEHFPIVSEKLKQLLESLPDSEHLQFFECELTNGKTDKKYYYLNILHNIECLDREQSECRFDEDNPEIVWRIFKLVMKMDKVADRNIFRMQEYKSSIFISSFLEKRLKEENITGYKTGESEDLRED